jgi:UDP-glucose 4-epimerase
MQTRDFIYVKDVAAANIAAITKGAGDIFNISTKTSVSLNEFMRTIEHVVNKRERPNIWMVDLVIFYMAI